MIIGLRAPSRSKAGKRRRKLVRVIGLLIAAAVFLWLAKLCFTNDEPYSFAIDNPTGDFLYALGRVALLSLYGLFAFGACVEIVHTRWPKFIGVCLIVIIAGLVLASVS